MQQAGLANTRPVKNATIALQVGDLFASVISGYGIYHEQWQPVPNDTWVEVMHSVYPTELVGAWVWSTCVPTSLRMQFPSILDSSSCVGAARQVYACTVSLVQVCGPTAATVQTLFQ